MKGFFSFNILLGKVADSVVYFKHNERKGKVVRKYNSKVTKQKVAKDWTSFNKTMQSKLDKLQK